MTSGYVSGLRWPGLLIPSILVLCFTCSATASDGRWDDDDSDKFESHLAAGEIPLALEIAGSVSDPATSDHLLARISEVQSKSGAQGSSFETISRIQNDLTRADAIQNGFPRGNAGGITAADFTEMMDLIQETIDPDSWEDNGGTGRMRPYPSGVFVDSSGTLQLLHITDSASWSDLRRNAAVDSGNRSANRQSKLRKISLNRLEKELQLLNARGRDPEDVMKLMAGMFEVHYLLVYPESGDVVIAGPAGPWRRDFEGRAVNVQTDKPVLMLDDLVVCLRNAIEADGKFGCSIDPRRDRLAALREFVADSKLTGKDWRDEFRKTIGLQDISVFGIDSRTHTARVIVEADYRMKLIGMGLEESVPDLASYMDSMKLDANGNAPPMDVVRWWFTMNYDAVSANQGRDVFHLEGQGVRLLSESEFLAQDGSRQHTGKASTASRDFAGGFTRHFDKLSTKYPVYGQLKNVFDLALIANLIKNESVADAVGWHLTYFGSPKQATDRSLVYQPEMENVPRNVESVVSHKTINSRRDGRKVRHMVTSVSGGVTFDADAVASKSRIKTSDDKSILATRDNSTPIQLEDGRWWWD